MLTSMLDTNVCIRAMRRGGENLRARLKADDVSLCLSTIIAHELYVGAEMSARPQYNFDLVSELTTKLAVLDFDNEAARHAADIKASLTKRGALIGSNDMLIAGHARSLGLKLVTSDLSDFSRVEGLRCEDWLVKDSR